MQIITSPAAMHRLAARWKRQGLMIGLVPTMGYLHQGHLSLMQKARQLVGPRGRIVVSIYVNPTQFGPQEDLSRYPRDPGRDRRLCREGRVDAIFVPQDAQMYPGRATGRYSTYVFEEILARGMESVTRPTHFRGVTTVVAKLFNLVQPTIAIFGQKDFQQARIVQRMTENLNFPVRIVVAPTVREPDGLALSSRNKYLTPGQRAQAVVLGRALRLARARARKAKRGIAAGLLKKQLTTFILQQPEARVDYIAFCDPVSLEPAARVRRGIQMALAVYIGKTRLIDNAAL